MTVDPDSFYAKKRKKGTTTWARRLRRVTAQTAGGALGYIVNNVPGALWGADLAGQAADWSATSVGPTKKIMAPIPIAYKRSVKNGGSSGPYAGKLKGAKVGGGVMRTCKTKGFHATTETYGSVNDPDTVLIKNSTFALNSYGDILVGAILRKLFARAGIPLNDSRLELPLLAWDNSDGFEIQFEFVTPITSVVSMVIVPITDNKSLEALIGDLSSAKTKLVDYWSGTGTEYIRRVFLYSYDLNTPTVYKRLAACVNMESEEIHCHCQVGLTVQNRTAAAESVGNLDLDRIDSQPLEVHVFEFSSGAPIAKVTRPGFEDQLNSGNTTGLKLMRVAEFSPNQVALQNAPDSKIWKNCVQHTKSVLQPGQMKKTFIRKDYILNFKKFMSTLRVDAISGENMYRVSGKSQILHFSEALRTPSINKVTVFYERREELGMYLVSKKQAAPFISSIGIFEVNNTTE